MSNPVTTYFDPTRNKYKWSTKDANSQEFSERKEMELDYMVHCINRWNMLPSQVKIPEPTNLDPLSSFTEEELREGLNRAYERKWSRSFQEQKKRHGSITKMISSAKEIFLGFSDGHSLALGIPEDRFEAASMYEAAKTIFKGHLCS